MEETRRNAKSVQSVHRALNILEYLIFCGDGKKLAEVTEACGLNKTTAYHLLKTLESRGYVEQTPDTLKYKTGGRMFELAMKAYQSVNLNIICQPYLERLQKQFDETAGLYHYAKRNGYTQCICTLVQESANPVRVLVELGKWLPLACTAAGKIYLSCLEPEAFQEALAYDVCPKEKRPKEERLEEQMETVRRKHYCLEAEEHEVGIVNVAAPIYKYTGRAIASICISVPVQRASKEHLKEMVQALVPIGDEISRMPL